MDERATVFFSKLRQRSDVVKQILDDEPNITDLDLIPLLREEDEILQLEKFYNNEILDLDEYITLLDYVDFLGDDQSIDEILDIIYRDDPSKFKSRLTSVRIQSERIQLSENNMKAKIFAQGNNHAFLKGGIITTARNKILNEEGEIFINGGVTNGSFLGLTKEGKLIKFQTNNNLQIERKVIDENVKFISTCNSRFAYLKRDGTLVVYNANGTVDRGYFDEASGVTRRPPTEKFVKIFCSDNRVIGITEEGAIEEWTRPGLSVSHNIDGRFIDVATSDSYCIGIKEDGSLVIWDAYGPFTNLSPNSNVPLPQGKFIKVDVKDEFFVCLRDDGVVFFWHVDSPELNRFDGPYTKFVVDNKYNVIALKENGKIEMLYGDKKYKSQFPKEGLFTDIAVNSKHFFGMDRSENLHIWKKN